jgi:hypothetical protein
MQINSKAYINRRTTPQTEFLQITMLYDKLLVNRLIF